jgi:hypothetical protein
MSNIPLLKVRHTHSPYGTAVSFVSATSLFDVLLSVCLSVCPAFKNFEKINNGSTPVEKNWDCSRMQSGTPGLVLNLHVLLDDDLSILCCAAVRCLELRRFFLLSLC